MESKNDGYTSTANNLLSNTPTYTPKCMDNKVQFQRIEYHLSQLRLNQARKYPKEIKSMSNEITSKSKG